MIIDDFLYVRERNKTYRCATKGCHARIECECDSGICLWRTRTGCHTHLPCREKIESIRKKTAFKEKLHRPDSFYKPIRHTYNDAFEMGLWRTHSARRKFIYRHVPRPQNPVSIESIDYTDPLLATILLKTIDSWKMMIFGLRPNLKRLVEASTLYMDGTFKTCCKLYKVLFIIHAKCENEHRPVLFCLLANMKCGTYELLFRTILQLLHENGFHGVQFPRHGAVVKTDFEFALVKALGAFDCVVSGCYFHFCQSLFRTVKRKNHRKLSDANSMFVVRKMMQLPFLTERQIACVVPVLRREAMRYGIGEIWDCFERTFLNTRIPIKNWCCLKDEDRTNNACESFNSAFAKLFRNLTARPSFGELIKNINVVFSTMDEFVHKRSSREHAQHTENCYIHHVLERIKDSFVPSDINKVLAVLARRKDDCGAFDADLDDVMANSVSCDGFGSKSDSDSTDDITLSIDGDGFIDDSELDGVSLDIPEIDESEWLIFRGESNHISPIR